MLISWAYVRFRNNPLNKLDDILIKGLPKICDVSAIKTKGLNINSGYRDEYWMIIELL